MSQEATSERVLTARQAELLDQLEELSLTEGFTAFTIDELADRLRCCKSPLHALAGPASRRDLERFEPARAVYERHTALAADRVRELVDEGVAAGRFRRVHAAPVADTVTR
jgi:hypothetical protein